jgi:hypothetical protein
VQHIPRNVRPKVKKNIMKTFSLLLVTVLFSTVVFANGIDEPYESAASVAVTNPAGGSLFKLFYKAEESRTVKVSIFNTKNKLVFTETLRHVSGFLRPYNFDGLAAGDYSIQIEDNTGRHVQEVTYVTDRPEKYVSLVKLADKGKYLVYVNTKLADKVNINVYNEFDQLIHSQVQSVEDNFAEVLNLKKIDKFTIEVSDSQGLLKSIKN